MSRLKVLVICENSGIIREAFRAQGFEAWSCDLLPSDQPSPYHHQGDIRGAMAPGGKLAGIRWDLIIAHPDCTYLTCSAEWAYKDGPYHQKVKPGTLVGAERRQAREDALDFVRWLMALDCEHIAIENPAGAISSRIRKADQYIQPHQFGHDASKKTGLWLKNLPPLQPTKHIAPRMVNGLPRWANQTDSGQNRLPPSADRWKKRAETYQGWADAMADQWGEL